MRRNYTYRYNTPAEVMYDAMLAVGLAGPIGFVGIMMYSINGSDFLAKAARKYRWIGVGIGCLFFAFAWGGMYLLGKFAPGFDGNTAMVILILLYIAWLIFCLIRKFRARNK